MKTWKLSDHLNCFVASTRCLFNSYWCDRCLFLQQYDIRNSPNLCLSLRTKFKFNHYALFYCSEVFMCFCIVCFNKQSSWFFFSFKNWFSLKNRPLVIILWFPHTKRNRCCLIDSSMCNLHFHPKFSRERSLKNNPRLVTFDRECPTKSSQFLSWCARRHEPATGWRFYSFNRQV